MKRCMGCMREYGDEHSVCPHCGFAEGTQQENALHMIPGSVLADRYVIGKVIGYGGFGVTYVGWDSLLETRVAIKEYLPSEFSTRVIGQTEVTVFSGDKQQQFADGMKKFIDEAKKLAKFHSTNGIVKIFDSIEINNTAYIIMELLEGETLAELLKREGHLSEDKTMEMMIPIIESLDMVHEDGIIHRDIAPDNIFVTNSGEVKLIDFGAARYATTTHSRSLTVIIKPGYSPEEQYRSRGDQGPHTDVYAVAATMYKMLTGVTPPDALERRALFENKKKDILDPIRKHCKEVSTSRENAILNALNVRIEDRTPDMKEFMAELTSVEPVKRRAGNIKKIDLYKWPIWAKITFPVITAALIVFIVLINGKIKNLDVDPNSDITIPDGQTRVPSVVNKSYFKGQYDLKGQKLAFEISDRVPSEKVEKDLVMYQSINGGAVVQQNSLVKLVVSGGALLQPVPDVRGLSREKAEEQLGNLNFSVLVKETYDNTIAEGYVVAQSIAPDAEAKDGSEITLTVSKGRDPARTFEEKDVTLTNFIGMKYGDALKEAQRLGVTVKITQKKYSSSFDKDTVMDQRPEPDSTVKNTAAVELVISLGYSKITVPDVKAIEEEKAVAMLEGRGLRCKVTYEQNNNIAAGHVASQDPVKDTEVDPETLINLVVSTGAAEFDMPDVVGKDVEEAKKLLESRGLVVLLNYEQNKNKPEGTVLMQSVKSGSGVIRGDNIILTICTHSETITVPYLIGKTQSEAEKELRAAGFKVNVITVQGSDEDSGKVVAQSPTAGSGLRKGDTVSVSVCEGGADDTVSSNIGSKTGSAGDKSEDLSSLTVKLSESSLTLEIGETHDLSYNTDTSKWTITSEEWSTGNSSVATVDGRGKVSAAGSGTTEIKVTLTGKSSNGQSVTRTASCNVKVNEPVQPDNIKLSSTTLEMKIGDTATLEATVTPESAKNKTVTWSTSDSAVATVEGGYIKALSEGTATITAETANGRKATCTVTVKPVVPTAITLDSNSVTLFEGEEKTITATVLPSDAKDKSVIWTTGDSAVATVNGGKITAVSKGTTTITAKTSNGLTAECQVTVNEIVPTSVTLNRTDYIDLFEGDTELLIATVNPENAKDKSLKWESSDTNVATVGDGRVTAVNAGTASITVTTSNGLTASCWVRVNEVLADSITLDQTKLEIYTDDTAETGDRAKKKLTATIFPENTKDKSVKWTSSNTRVVTVEDGVVTPVGEGKATITAETKNGKKVECKVQVASPYPTEIRLEESEIVMIRIGSEHQLVAKIAPGYAREKEITWTSSDKNVVTVDSNGWVKAEGAGTATITATTMKDKDKTPLTATCVVTVSNVVDSGKCGSRATWELSGEGKLSIGGMGDMEDYPYGSTIANSAPWAKYAEKITEVYVGGVEKIGNSSFANLGNLKKVQIENSVKRIGEYAFSNCTSLNSVSLSSGLEEIREGAFSTCESLVNVALPSTVYKIDGHAFNSCIKLESIVIPDRVTVIEGGTFFGCSNLSSVTLPNYLNEIKENAFTSTDVDNLSIPNSVTRIGKQAFAGCSSLSNVSLSEDSSYLQEIGEGAFESTGFQSIVIPRKVGKIGRRAFYNCKNLSSAKIPPNVYEIGEQAFGYLNNDNNPKVKGFKIKGSKYSAAYYYYEADKDYFKFEEYYFVW